MHLFSLTVPAALKIKAMPGQSEAKVEAVDNEVPIIKKYNIRFTDTPLDTYMFVAMISGLLAMFRIEFMQLGRLGPLISFVFCLISIGNRRRLEYDIKAPAFLMTMNVVSILTALMVPGARL
jgi:hypothetical protein